MFLLQRLATFACFSILPSFDGKMLGSIEEMRLFIRLTKLASRIKSNSSKLQLVTLLTVNWLIKRWESCSLLVLSFLLFLLFSWREIIFFTSQDMNAEEILIILSIKKKWQLCSETNNFQSSSFPIGRDFSILRRKMNGPKSTEMDINVLVSAPTQ